MRITIPVLALLLAVGAPLATANAADAGAASPATPSTATPPWFARIGTHVIPADEYQNAVRTAYRNKFYHGQPPEAQVEALWRDIGQEMIDRILLTDEAARLGIKPDEKEVQDQIDGYEKRYAGSPNWPKMREQALPSLRAHLESKSALKVLEQDVRARPTVSDEAVRQFYETRKELFTEPEKLRLSIILLRVDPSSGREVWEAALKEGQSVLAQLKGGADFAEMAKLRSADPSREKGGDLGYTHRGMLPEALQAKIDELKPGTLSEPIRVLEGVVIYRIEDRLVSTLRPFESVADRARDLLKREAGDKAWKDFMAALRAQGKVEIAPEFQKAMTAKPPETAAPAGSGKS